MKLKKPIAKLGRKERNIGKTTAGTTKKPKVKTKAKPKTAFFMVYGKHKYGGGRTELICRVEMEDTSLCKAEFIRLFYANYGATFDRMIPCKYDSSLKYHKFGRKSVMMQL